MLLHTFRRIKNSILQRLVYLRQWHLLIIVISVSLYIISFSYWTTIRYLSFHSTCDLAVYNQALWTTIHGYGLFFETLDIHSNPGGSFFGIHISPLLFLILPIYLIFQSPITLLVLQSVVIGATAIPIFLLARKYLQDRWVIVGYVIIYLLNVPINWVNWFDFHVEAFFPLFILSAFWFWTEKKWPPYILFTILSLSVIEATPAFVGVLSFCQFLYTLKKQGFSKSNILSKSSLYSLALTIISLIWFVAALSIRDFINPPKLGVSPWQNLGGVWGLVFTPLTNPSLLVSTLFQNFSSKQYYLLVMLGPYFFTSFMGGEMLVPALVWIYTAFLSSLPLYYNIQFQYSSFVVPFVILSSIFGLRRFANMTEGIGRHKILRVVLALTMIGVVATWVDLAPIPDMFEHSSLPKENPHTYLLMEIVSMIPANASVYTQNDIYPQLSSRPKVYIHSNVTGVSTDYIIGDLTSPWSNWNIRPDLHSLTDILNEVFRSGSYGVLASADGILLLKRGYIGPPTIFVPFKASYNYQHLALYSGSIVDDPTSFSGKIFAHKINDKPLFWYGPYKVIQPGLYNVTYRLKVPSNDVGPILTIDVFNSTGLSTITSKTLYGKDFKHSDTWTNITLSFLCNSITKVEFRGTSATKFTDIFLDTISVEQISAWTPYLSPPPQKITFDYRNLATRNGAFKGLLLHKPGQVGFFWWGPYVTLPVGKYEVTFWLKVLGNPPSDVLVTLDVVTDLGVHTLATMDVTGGNLTYDHPWSSFTLTFQLEKTTSNIEFRGRACKASSEIILSNIEIVKIG